MTTRRTFIKHTAWGSALFLLPSFRMLQPFPADTDRRKTLALDGEWYFFMDPAKEGPENVRGHAVNTIALPGSLQSQGFGNDVAPDTEWWNGQIKGVWRTSPVYEKYRQPGDVKIYEFLQPEKHYLGAVWYIKEFDIPRHWKNKRIVLFLERVHWESSVSVNGKEIGSRMYLGVPHEYDLTNALQPGTNRLMIRVDNSRIVDVGDMPHSISEQTQGTWNGIAGRVELRATDKVWIDQVQVYPCIAEKKIDIALTLSGLLKDVEKAIVKIAVKGPSGKFPAMTKQVETVPAEIRLKYHLGNDVVLWDEHHPVLYELSVSLQGKSSSERFSDHRQVTFGMREIRVSGTQVAVNGSPVHLRGNVDCAIFPDHGYPPMDVAWWKRLWLLYKDWGMNLVRFHSWCPPEAAFAAADETGLYLQPECSEWANNQTEEQFRFLIAESLAMLRQYGNHPSFIMMALGNEKSIKKEYLENLMGEWKKDKRRLYTGKTGGNPLLDEADYYVGGASRKGTRARYYLSWPPRPEPSYFYQFQPSTERDYVQVVQDDSRPFISHEIAQRCSYPDVVNLPEKFKGTLHPTYLSIARDQLEERGMLDQTARFVEASGKWQVAMYKEEIEANLRTPGIGGFHLLSLQDFPGQGTAPVGFMDFFYEAKPYVTSEEVRRFCNHTVILARMKKRIWLANEKLEGTIELYNFSGKTFRPDRSRYTVKSASGEVLHEQEFEAGGFPDGSVFPVENFSIDLSRFPAPARYSLEVSMGQFANNWDFWVYPESVPAVTASDILISEIISDDVKAALENGKTVLLLPRRDQLKGKLVQCFGTFYWTAFDFHGGETSACGLLTDPEHPVFRHFPTDFHGNWQWWELLTKASPMILDDFEAKNPWPKDYRPLIQMIPSWKVNRKLAVLAEARVEKGKLMLCSMDITSDLQNRRVAAQFRYSLLKYLQSGDFNPATVISYKSLNELFTD
jgi:hypothetical protein